MAEESAQTVLSVLFSHILPLVPGMSERLEEGASLLDLGCGRGRALLLLAERFPNSSFLGLRPLDDAVAYATAQAIERGLGTSASSSATSARSTSTPSPRRSRSSTTFDAVHDQARPLALLKGIRRTLRPDGAYLMQDIQGSSHHPRERRASGRAAPVHDLVHALHERLARPGWRRARRDVGQEKARELLAQAGFASVDVHLLEHDPFNAYFVVRP